MNIAYVGSTEVTKSILKRSKISPDVVISFKKKHKGRISGFAHYEEYDEIWTTVESINSDKAYGVLKDAEVDLILVMGWQELLGKEVLSIPSIGSIGRHLSLLPKRRGRAPVAWALIHGLTESGVTLFWLDEGVDSGDIAIQRKVGIDKSDHASDLHEKMTNRSVIAINKLVDKIKDGKRPATPQDDSEATYTHVRRTEMGLIDWKNTANYLHNFIRGQSHPYPGAFTYHKLDRVRVWYSEILHNTSVVSKPGTVLRDKSTGEIVVQTGEGRLLLDIEKEEQRFTLTKGSVLGCSP